MQIKVKQLIEIIVFLVLGVLVVIVHLHLKKEPDKDMARSLTKAFDRPELLDKEAPNFELTLLNGTKFKLKNYKSKKLIIINFFATWSEPCKKEIPALNKFYLKNKDKDFIMIGINAGEPSFLVKRYIEENEIKFPVGIIPNGSNITDAYKIKSYPTTVFIGYRGRIDIYEVGAILNPDVVFSKKINRHKKVLQYKKESKIKKKK